MHNVLMIKNRKLDAARGQRIKYVRTVILGMRSQEEFAKWIGGVTRGAVGNWELGKEIGLDNMAAISERANVSLDWLAYNKGGMPQKNEKVIGLGEHKSSRLISSYDPSSDPDTSFYTDDSSHENNGAYSREHWVPSVEGALPELDVKLGAGEGIVGEIITLSVGEERISGHKVVAEWLVPESYLIHEAKANGQTTIVMEVIGDSMQPNYMPGDRVLVDLLQTKLVADTVYAISDGYGEPQIKRLQRVPFSKPTQVKIISDNPVLETFTVELEQLTIIGRVCGHIARR